MNNDILDNKDKFLVKPKNTKISAGIAILVGLFLVGIGAFIFVRNEVTEEMEQQIRAQQIELEERRAEVEKSERKKEELFRIQEKAIQDSLENI